MVMYLNGKNNANGLVLFELILVIGSFRSATPYLSIIKYLSASYKIGIAFEPLNGKQRKKTGGAHDQFVKLCLGLGAHLVDCNLQNRTRILVVQQFLYSDDWIKKLQRSIQSKKNIGMLTLASAGLDGHDDFLKKFKIKKVYAYDKGLISFLLNKRSALSKYTDVSIIQVGLPYHKYPLLSDFNIDWLVVSPTLFSFHSELAKQDYLKNILNLLDQIPKSQVVAYKAHNGDVNDYFAPYSFQALAKYLIMLRVDECLLRIDFEIFPDFFYRNLMKLRTVILYLQVKKRMFPVDILSADSGISLEAFLPGVKKGVIGGNSNSMWGVQFYGLPYWNCVNPLFKLKQSELLGKSSEKYLDMNMLYFGVEFNVLNFKLNAKKPSSHKSTSQTIVDCIFDDMSSF
jgi:hypothetical protein